MSAAPADLLRAVNKAILAIVGGGVVTLLVTLGVFPDSVGTTITGILVAAGAVVAVLVGPSNKPLAPSPDA